MKIVSRGLLLSIFRPIYLVELSSFPTTFLTSLSFKKKLGERKLPTGFPHLYGFQKRCSPPWQDDYWWHQARGQLLPQDFWDQIWAATSGEIRPSCLLRKKTLSAAYFRPIDVSDDEFREGSISQSCVELLLGEEPRQSCLRCHCETTSIHGSGKLENHWMSSYHLQPPEPEVQPVFLFVINLHS
jgi:hypothetical protein